MLMSEKHLSIIIDAESLRVTLTGVGVYAKNLAENLAHQTVVKNLNFWVGTELGTDLDNTIARYSIVERPTKLRRILRRLFVNKPLRGIYVRLPKRIQKMLNDIDPIKRGNGLLDLSDASQWILHGPNFVIPQGFPGTEIVTIHDLSIYRHPSFHPADRVAFMRDQLPAALKNADHVIAVSEFTKRELVELFSVDIDRVSVVHNGLSDDFSEMPLPQHQRNLKSVNLDDTAFILVAGTIEPRKNLGCLLDAYCALDENLRSQYKLVIAGGRGWNCEADVKRINELSKSHDVLWLNYVELELLRALYSGASVTVVPSHYEGFGFPILESMACGTPVVCAENSSLIEVGGDAALFFETDNSQHLASRMTEVLTVKGVAPALRIKGLAHAENFSWQRCAQETVAVYHIAQTRKALEIG